MMMAINMMQNQNPALLVEKYADPGHVKLRVHQTKSALYQKQEKAAIETRKECLHSTLWPVPRARAFGADSVVECEHAREPERNGIISLQNAGGGHLAGPM